MNTPSHATLRALDAIARERTRQDRKWSRGDSFPGGLGFGPAAADTLRSMLLTITRDHLASGDVEAAAKAICDQRAMAGNADAASVLLEELAEVTHALVGERDPVRVVEELTQLGAVASKIIEALDPTVGRLDDRKLRIYVAAPMGEAHVAKLLGAMLTREGYDVVSGWTARLDAQGPHPTDDALTAIQVANQHDLDRADLVVAWTARGMPRATYSEIGWALANGTRVLWIQGEPGTGGNLYDRERLVTKVLLADDATARENEGRILAVVMALEVKIRASRAGVPPLAVSPASRVTGSLLLAVKAACAAKGQATMGEALAAVQATPEHAHVGAREVLDAIHTLDELGAVIPGDPGRDGERRWEPATTGALPANPPSLCRYKDDGWFRCTPYDRAERRAVWMRTDDASDVVELCGGREGDDCYVRLVPGQVLTVPLLNAICEPLLRAADKLGTDADDCARHPEALARLADAEHAARVATEVPR